MYWIFVRESLGGGWGGGGFAAVFNGKFKDNDTTSRDIMSVFILGWVMVLTQLISLFIGSVNALILELNVYI